MRISRRRGPLLPLAAVALLAVACHDEAAQADQGAAVPADAIPRLLLPDDRSAFEEPRRADAPEEHLVGSRDLCVVTQYSEAMESYAVIAVANQRRYAATHGYWHLAYRGRLSGDRFVDPEASPSRSIFRYGLYWQKIAAMQRALAMRQQGGDGPTCRWAMWIDADALFTNLSVTIESVLAAHAPPPAAVLLSREQLANPERLINTGVFFVANSPEGRAFLDEIAALYPIYKDCLQPEQQAMIDTAFGLDCFSEDPPPFAQAVAGLRPTVAIAQQRAFNAYYRPTMGRQFAEASWQEGDWVAHLCGCGASKRLRWMRHLDDQVRGRYHH